MDQALKQKLTAKEKWIQVVLLILFAIVNYCIQVLSWAIAIFQWVSTLFTDKPNVRLGSFGKQLALYSYQIMLFLTYNSPKRPFPFSDWPRQTGKISELEHPEEK